MLKSEQERLAVVEEKVEAMSQKLEQCFKESKEFHRELLSKLETMSDDKVKIATLEERIRGQDGEIKDLKKIIGVVATGTAVALIQAIVKMI